MLATSVNTVAGDANETMMTDNELYGESSSSPYAYEDAVIQPPTKLKKEFVNKEDVVYAQPMKKKETDTMLVDNELNGNPGDPLPHSDYMYEDAVIVNQQSED